MKMFLMLFGIFLCATLPSGRGFIEFNKDLINSTTCEEFERDAKFDPTEIVDSMWRIFYLWSETVEMSPIIFSLVAKKSIQRFKEVTDAVIPELDIPWDKARFFMDPAPGVKVLFLAAITPGAYRAVVKKENRTGAFPIPKPLVKLADIRIKQVGRYIGLMSCEEVTAYGLVRQAELPQSEAECAAAAETIGFRGAGGKSYLYVKRKMSGEL